MRYQYLLLQQVESAAERRCLLHLRWGLKGVQIGSLFAASTESSAHQSFKEAISKGNRRRYQTKHEIFDAGTFAQK
jgi:hypothetical protein